MPEYVHILMEGAVMSTWVFALVVLLFGVGLAYVLDGMKLRRGSGSAEAPARSERAKWLYFWFLGRFPNEEEEAADEKEAKRLEQVKAAEQEKLKEKAEREKSKGKEGDWRE